MKPLFPVLFILCPYLLKSQHMAVSADKMNVFYIGLENPITISVENCPCSKIIAKATKGNITGSNCNYVFKDEDIGRTDVILYCKNADKLKKIGTSSFRVKVIPNPQFGIGPYWNSTCIADKKILSAQEYVRADYINLDFDARAKVDSFLVKIIKSDSSATMILYNYQNKLSEEIRVAFKNLKKDDIVVFDEIYVTGADRRRFMIEFLSLKIGIE